jgi:hypothetical protein
MTGGVRKLWACPKIALQCLDSFSLVVWVYARARVSVRERERQSKTQTYAKLCRKTA